MKKKHLVRALKDGLLLRDLRDTIYETEDTAPIIEAINKRLPEGYKIAPPGSIFVQVCGRGEREDLADYRNWKAGDVVEATGGAGDCYKKGEQFIVRGLEGDTVLTMLDSKGSTTNGWGGDNFRFISRPDNSIKTWRVGDWVECISRNDSGSGRLQSIEVGDVNQIVTVGGRNGSVRATNGGSWGNEKNYRLVRRGHAKVETPEPVEEELSEGDMIEITEDLHSWWIKGNKHRVNRRNGMLGVTDADGDFRALPIAAYHRKVQP